MYCSSYAIVNEGMKSSKAVGSGKAGKALALPDFPPSVHFLTYSYLEEQIDALKGTCATIRT